MPKHVLVVEDNPVVAKLVSETIRKMGYKVFTINDGLDAVNILEQVIPDIIFVDLVIPRVSGQKLCRMVRENENLKNTHLVILSGIAIEEEIELSRIGITATIAKSKDIALHVSNVLLEIDKGKLSRDAYKTYGFTKIQPRESILALLDSKKHIETILANLSDGLMEVSFEGTIIYANIAALNIFSSYKGNLIGSNFFSFFKGEVYLEILENIEKAQQKPQLIRDIDLVFEDRILVFDILSLEDAAYPSCIVILKDVTKKRLAKNALMKSEEYFRDLIENTTDMVQNISPEGQILYTNRSWRENLGYSEEELKSLNVQEIIAPDHLDKCMGIFAKILQGEEVHNIETTFMTKDGAPINVAGSVNCKFEDGQPVYTRGIFRIIK